MWNVLKGSVLGPNKKGLWPRDPGFYFSCSPYQLLDPSQWTKFTLSPNNSIFSYTQTVTTQKFVTRIKLGNTHVRASCLLPDSTRNFIKLSSPSVLLGHN